MRVFVLLLAWALGLSAQAHPLAPPLLEIQSGSDSRHQLLLRQPALTQGTAVAPVIPEDCQLTLNAPKLQGQAVETTGQLHCPQLPGREFGLSGLDSTPALLRWISADGRRFEALLRADGPSVTLPERPRGWGLALQYLHLGWLHILAGLDHLAFVLALVMIVPQLSRLVWTITSFTLGHSVTLALATLGIWRPPGAWVEWLIATSILLLAWELARGRGGLLSRQTPWIAGGFGLLHGLGFAGVLLELGVPQDRLWLALGSFNLGIELGQLAFVALCLALARAVRPWPKLQLRSRALLVYMIGSVGAFWWLDRGWQLV